jgi:hypothetical protein
VQLPGEGWIGGGRRSPDRVQVPGAGVGLSPGEGQQVAARALGQLGGGESGGLVEEKGQRRAREETDVVEREDRQKS